MSADNYYLIRKDPEGKFVPVMGFSSVDEEPTIRERDDLRFNTIEEALYWTGGEYTEYGTRVHPECYPEGSNPYPFITY